MDPCEPGAFLFWNVLIIIICILGIFGNIWSGIILLQRDFRSSSNYILLGMTLSDLLVLSLGIIRTLAKVKCVLSWDPDGAFGIFVFFWDWIAASGTKYFTLLISLERYIAVCHPFQARQWMSEKRVLFLTSSGFVVCSLIATWSYVYNQYIGTSYEIYVAIFLQMIPFIVIVILNMFVYRGFRKFQEKRRGITTAETAEISITRMLLTIVLVFGICNGFEFVRQIMLFANYFKNPTLPYDAYLINHLASVFYVTNSSLNFIIYLLMVQKFKERSYQLLYNSLRFCHIYIKPAREPLTNALSSNTDPNENLSNTTRDFGIEMLED